MSAVEKLADKTTFPKSVPYPHIYPEKRYHFLIFFQLALGLLLFLMDSDPFLPILTHANLQVLFSDHSNADHLFGTNVPWPNWISFPFLHSRDPCFKYSPPTHRAYHFGIDFIFPSKSPVPFTPGYPLVTQWFRYNFSLTFVEGYPASHLFAIKGQLIGPPQTPCSLPRRRLKWIETQTVPSIHPSQV